MDKNKIKISNSEEKINLKEEAIKINKDVENYNVYIKNLIENTIKE